MGNVGIRSYTLALVICVFGCKRQSEPTVTSPSGSGSSGAALVAPRPPLPNAVCPPRVLGPDPGPTKTTDEPSLGPPADVAKVTDACVVHASCTERPHGRCVHQAAREVTTFGELHLIPAHNECVYDECTSDDECKQTSTHEPKAELVCMCGDERNTCSFANCRSDADCKPFTCGGWHYCHSGADQCGPTKSCKQGDECVYSWEVKHYVCRDATPIAPD